MKIVKYYKNKIMLIAGRFARRMWRRMCVWLMCVWLSFCLQMPLQH